MNIKELLEKQKESIEKEVFVNYAAGTMLVSMNDGKVTDGVIKIRDVLTDNLLKQNKQSLLQHYDYLIEDLRGKLRKLPEKYRASFTEDERVAWWQIKSHNDCLDDQITTLLSIKKEIESI